MKIICLTHRAELYDENGGGQCSEEPVNSARHQLVDGVGGERLLRQKFGSFYYRVLNPVRVAHHQDHVVMHEGSFGQHL